LTTLLDVKEIHAGYDRQTVVRGLSMHVNRGGLVCLLGPSGCGKTTVLRSIAGFSPVDDGEIVLDGRIVSCNGFMIPPEKRHVGMVFQDNALFPHLSVAGNIAFGLRRWGNGSRGSTVGELVEVMGLQGLERRYPHELSGGQQQRVALARALAPGPELLLLDEPFSNLDVDLRERVGSEIRDILKQRGISTVLVTHDQHEAFALGDQIGVMRDGFILQWDTAYNLYHEPANRFVADFIGEGVFIRGRLVAPDAVDTEFGTIRGNRAYSWPKNSAVDVLLRPDDVHPDPGAWTSGEVVTRAFKGAETLYSLKLASGSTVLSLFPSHMDFAIGERVGIRVAPDHLVAFPVEQEP
jgi:iron(III) transport system ATP-binding protein